MSSYISIYTPHINIYDIPLYATIYTPCICVYIYIYIYIYRLVHEARVACPHLRHFKHDSNSINHENNDNNDTTTTTTSTTAAAAATTTTTTTNNNNNYYYYYN